ncbi:MAG: Uma2 family endonuclease [Burkholderiales bacterium]
MGNIAAPEMLARRWVEVIADPALRDLPYKIELNARGKIEMSPATNAHGRFQFLVGVELHRLLPDGAVITEASVLTAIGVRVPDVAWASRRFVETFGMMTPFPRAPEICVEVDSPSNTEEETSEKIKAYLDAGAQEVWVVSEEGRVRYYAAGGEITASAFGIEPLLPPPIAKS